MIARALRTALVAAAVLVTIGGLVAMRARGHVDRAWLDRARWEGTTRDDAASGGAVRVRIGDVAAVTRTGASPHHPGALLRGLAGACADGDLDALADIARGRTELPAPAEASLARGVDLHVGSGGGALVCLRPSRGDDAIVAVTARPGVLSTRFEIIAAPLPRSLDALAPRAVPPLLAALPSSLAPMLVSESREGTRRVVIARSGAVPGEVERELVASLAAARALVEREGGVIRARRGGARAWITVRGDEHGTVVSWIESQHEEATWTTVAR